MDPFSALFAAILQTTGDSVYEHTKELYGTDVRAEVVSYQGRSISFQYQLWQIKQASVCADQRDQLAEFSACTVSARNFFAEACRYLQKNRGSGWKYDKYKNMYCSAAVSFKPTIASIQSAGENGPLQAARKECNNLIVATSAKATPDLLAERDRACRRYEELKNAR